MVSLRDLKESQRSVLQAIKELEKEGEVLVTLMVNDGVGYECCFGTNYT